jgi:hypothetical protein
MPELNPNQNTSPTDAGAARSETALLTVAGAVLHDALNPEQAKNPRSLLEAFNIIYSSMTGFISQYATTGAPQRSPFIQACGESINGVQNAFVIPAVEQRRGLGNDALHPENVETLKSFAGQVQGFLKQLAQTKQGLSADVAALWAAGAQQHHERFNGNCHAGGGCPSQTICGTGFEQARGPNLGAEQAR